MRRLALPVVVLLAGCAATPPGSVAPSVGDHRLYQIAAGRLPTLAVANAAGDFTVTVRGGEARVERDGVPVPASRVERAGSLLTVLDARLGVRLGPADRARDAAFDLAVNTAGTPLEAVARREPHKILLVAALRSDGAGAAAGLRERDVVTHIDGQAVSRPNDLNVIAADRRAGELVVFRVLRRGRAVDVSVEAGPAPPAPSPAMLEAHYRDVIG
jgi:hypothetical protein